MGNTRSRHSGEPSKKQAKKHQRGDSSNNNNATYTPSHSGLPQHRPQYQQHSPEGDQYSAHPTKSPTNGAQVYELPGGYRPNLSPGRIDQSPSPQPFDPTQQLQYGTRVKRAGGISGTGTGVGMNGEGSYNNLYQDYGNNNMSNGQGNGYHSFQTSPYGDTLSYTSPRVSQSTSRISSQPQPRGSLSPTHFYREDEPNGGGLVSSMAGMSMDGPNRSNLANVHYASNNNHGRYSSQDQSDSQRYSGNGQQPYQLPSHHQPYQLHSSINNHSKYASMTNHNPYTPEHRVRHDPYSPTTVLVNNTTQPTNGHNHKPNLSGIRPTPTPATTPPTPPAPTPKAADLFVGAGPLIDTSSSSANRPLGSDQVFARLAKQNPTNPRESEKRARINRWMDDVARALVLNPDTSVPGWIIPVVPDDYDILETPFYFDRITFELDIMAPVGKTLRKAIDINCAAGDWAMDIAIKYPKTIVYAIDPALNRYPTIPQRTPENCRFKMRDIKEQEGEFDLVHQRLGAYRILISEWVPHFAELGRLTRPGGWIQLAESNGMIVRGGSESLKVNRWVEKAALSSGLNPFQVVDALIPTILGAGLINVECYEYGIPLGNWGGVRGSLAMKSYLQMVESLREEIIETHRLEDGLFEEAVAQMQHECAMHKAELVMKVVCAQKPPFSDDIWR